jgi:hypothetical protein
MPERAALIAVLIIDCPLCVDCIAAKSEISLAGVKGYLKRMEGMVGFHRASEGRCRACGSVGNVFSLNR